VEVTVEPNRGFVLAIDEPSQVGEARRKATVLAAELGFDETARGRVALVVTETATNLHKHARGGDLIVRGWDSSPGGPAVEVLALDRGPGMADVARCLEDGYSTAGSPGTGLGAMSRLSDFFEVYSQPGSGTVVLARLGASPRIPPSGAASARVGLETGAVSVPVAGEMACGDAYDLAEHSAQSLLLVVDGLGHGPAAQTAAWETVAVFRDRAAEGPETILWAAHAALRSTRGAAMAVALVDRERAEVRYAGVGNIAGAILAPNGGRSTSLVSHNGTVGHAVRRVQEFVYPWPPGALLVMNSDGLGSRWDLATYPGLAARHPAAVAGVLFRDFRRPRDDATIVVARERCA
jgi:anti-sigma regulatory factor (Ser/Thr protein kinase)